MTIPWKPVFDLAKTYDLHELSVSTPEETITVRRGIRAVAVPPPIEQTGQAEPAAAVPDFGHYIKVVSPLSGVFYRSPAPGAEPFVREGEKVQFGDGLCIIEAMKVMNEITSESGGTVYKIVPSNGDVVNEGDVLFLIDPGTSG